MAEFESTEEDFDYTDLEPYEEVTEDVEKKADKDDAKQSKLLSKIAAKQAAMEAQLEREKLVNEFYSKANDEAKEFADVLLAGVSDPQKVKKMLELAEAKAAKIAGNATPAQDEAVEEDDVEKAFAAPLASAPPEVKDPAKEIAEATRRGDAKAGWAEFLSAPSGDPFK